MVEVTIKLKYDLVSAGSSRTAACWRYRAVDFIGKKKSENSYRVRENVYCKEPGRTCNEEKNESSAHELKENVKEKRFTRAALERSCVEEGRRRPRLFPTPKSSREGALLLLRIPHAVYTYLYLTRKLPGFRGNRFLFFCSFGLCVLRYFSTPHKYSRGYRSVE